MAHSVNRRPLLFRTIIQIATPEFELLGAFEVDSEEEIRKIRDAGLDAHAPIKGKTSGSCLSRIRKQLNPIEASHE